MDKHTLQFACVVDGGSAPEMAAATATWAKDCITGLSAMIKSDDVARLRQGRSTVGLRRPSAETAHERLSQILRTRTPAAVREALLAINALPDGSIYRYDAWYTVLDALRSTSDSGSTVAHAVTQHRNRTRATGRRTGIRTVSRPTLIKGLEYDHAIVLNADAHDPHQPLRRADTRA